MTSAQSALGVAVMASSALAGGWGAWRWYRVEPSAAFWKLLRASQALVLLFALLSGLLVALGREEADLRLLYELLPLGVHFIAEQLRVVAAQAVLDARGIEDAAGVGELPPAQQRSVVLAIVRREMGTMAAAALVTVVLALRAAGWL